jgi:hypothetical protein
MVAMMLRLAVRADGHLLSRDAAGCADRLLQSARQIRSARHVTARPRRASHHAVGGYHFDVMHQRLGGASSRLRTDLSGDQKGDLKQHGSTPE